MKSKFLKKRAFTLVECIFAILVLSIISMYIISGMNNFLKIQNSNMKDNFKLSDVENTVMLIKSNIKMNKPFLSDINTDIYDIKIIDLGEVYQIKLILKDNMEKLYEFYISKES